MANLTIFRTFQTIQATIVFHLGAYAVPHVCAVRLKVGVLRRFFEKVARVVVVFVAQLLSLGEVALMVGERLEAVHCYVAQSFWIRHRVLLWLFERRLCPLGVGLMWNLRGCGNHHRDQLDTWSVKIFNIREIFHGKKNESLLIKETLFEINKKLSDWENPNTVFNIKLNLENIYWSQVKFAWSKAIQFFSDEKQ